MKKYFRFLIILCIIILGIIIFIRNQNNGAGIDNSYHGTHKVLNEKEKNRIETNISKVKLGDNIHTVKGLLGEPTFQQEAAKKETGELESAILTYYFMKRNLLLLSFNYFYIL